VDGLGAVTLEGLSEHIAAVTGEASLELPYAGKTYMAPQPGLTRGLRCTQYLAAKDAAARKAVIAEARKDNPEKAPVENLPDLTLTRTVVDEMDADDVPIDVITTFSQVALVAWTRGQAAAEQFVRNLRSDDGGEASGEAKSGTPSRKKTGTATASGRKTRKPASGRTTASPPTS
jgi:hypothetical protein